MDGLVEIELERARRGEVDVVESHREAAKPIEHSGLLDLSWSNSSFEKCKHGTLSTVFHLIGTKSTMSLVSQTVATHRMFVPGMCHSISE